MLKCADDVRYTDDTNYRRNRQQMTPVSCIDDTSYRQNRSQTEPFADDNGSRRGRRLKVAYTHGKSYTTRINFEQPFKNLVAGKRYLNVLPET